MLGRSRGRGVGRGVGFALGLIQQAHPPVLAPGVDRKVAADGEEPLSQVRRDGGRVLVTEAEEGLLRQVAGAVHVTAEQVDGVADQRPLETRDRRTDPCGAVYRIGDRVRTDIERGGGHGACGSGRRRSRS